MTPELTKYAERLAEKHTKEINVCVANNCTPAWEPTRKGFLAGFCAAQEVFELRGRIEGVKYAMGYTDYCYAGLEAEKAHCEARLASLLGSEGRDG